MEILASSPVMAVTWWFFIAIAAVLIGAIVAVLAVADDYMIVATIFTIIAIIGIIILITTPAEIPTDQMSYTIEITDSSMYKTLVDKGYTFKRLFESKQIYKIIGDILK